MKPILSTGVAIRSNTLHGRQCCANSKCKERNGEHRWFEPGEHCWYSTHNNKEVPYCSSLCAEEGHMMYEAWKQEVGPEGVAITEYYERCRKLGIDSGD